jgi:hypothetical protein
MLSPGQSRARVVTMFLAFVCVAGSAAVAAQKTSDAQVEAAYVYNFAKFVEWPERKFASSNAPIRFCVMNDFAFEANMSRTVIGKSIAGHPLQVVQVRDTSGAMQCHVLFVNAMQERQLRHMHELLRESNVLTIGETDTFVEEGGIINFFLQDDQVQFRINDKAAREAGLYLSSRLLSLAKRATK